jgi:transposase-like protein
MEPRHIAVDRDRRFLPPFCPRRTCTEHRRPDPGFRFSHAGSYPTRRDPAVPRFRCLTCNSTFSRTAFSTAYYLKRPELLRPVAAGLVAGSAHRQIARTLDCAPSTVTRLAARIGRHALLFHHSSLGELASIDESIVFDHFETFEFSQDLPFGIGTAVGQRSWFVYAIDPAPHRRAGYRTAAQERRLRSRPRRRLFGGYDGSTDRVFSALAQRAIRPVRIVTDGHASYARQALRATYRERIRLEVYANPKRGPKGAPRTARAVTRDRAMFAVDLLHGLIRHSQPAHKRETIAFGRRLNALLERAYVFVVWRNFVKSFKEEKPDGTSPAVRLGLTRGRWRWAQVLGCRLFPDRVGVRDVDRRLYDRRWTTAVVGRNDRHRLKLAY